MVAGLMSVCALPVQRGCKARLTLTDGTEVVAEARGDDHLLYWVDGQGRRYVRVEGTQLYRAADPATLAARRHRMLGQPLLTALQARTHRLSLPLREATGAEAPATRGAADARQGAHRGLVILVEFPQQGFGMAQPRSYYDRLLNDRSLSPQTGEPLGVSGYFMAQSNGRFDLELDVAGPVMASHDYAYYGADHEARMGELVAEACLAVKDDVSFARYDWDQDGEAEEVFILYAGYGEADHPDHPDYIWPHMYALSGYDAFVQQPLVIDGTTIDVYACANERKADGQTAGIGTFCHEFSHCLGLPDFYDTGQSGNYGMASWDLMAYGSYNGGGYTPAGYTGYEKMCCGWITPVELRADTLVTGLRAQSRGGETYVIYNGVYRNEMMVLDNRQRHGSDARLPGHGLLVTHVDFDQTLWDYNLVNATGCDSLSGVCNDHQRVSLLHADGSDSEYSEAGDAYPHLRRDSITPQSRPAAAWYNGTEGFPLSILHIAEAPDSTVGFEVRRHADAALPPAGYEVVLRETFDRCAGTGGNDSRYSGTVAQADLMPDLGGWQGEHLYGGQQCARVGSTYVGAGAISSPWFTLPADTVTLTFRAAGWDTRREGTDLNVTLTGSGVFAESGTQSVRLTMSQGSWTTHELHLAGQGSARITWQPHRRFFLDDVSVLVGREPSASQPTGVERPALGVQPSVPTRYYSLGGRFMGTRWELLPRGAYVAVGSMPAVDGSAPPADSAPPAGPASATSYRHYRKMIKR